MAGLRSARGNIACPPYTNGPYKWSEMLILDGFQGLSAERVGFTEKFLQIPGLNADVGIAVSVDFESLGTNCVTAQVSYSATTAGILLTTAGADNDQVIICPHLDTKQTAWTGTQWGTENQVIWEAIYKASDIADILIFAGLKLTNDPTVATDADQVYFRFSTDDSDTNWELVSSIGGVDTTSDSGVAVTAGIYYKFKISIDSARKATMWIDDKALYTTAALTNDVDFIPYVGIQALSAAAATGILVSESISRIIYE